MEATYLRIGNYLIDRDNRLCRVEAIKPDDYKECEYEFEAPAISGAITGLPHKPIQLTEEWLVKSNAKIINANFQSYILERFILTWKSAYKYWYVMDSESLTYLTKIEFVHEWQNFYFVMQGVELRFE